MKPFVRLFLFFLVFVVLVVGQVLFIAPFPSWWPIYLLNSDVYDEECFQQAAPKWNSGISIPDLSSLPALTEDTSFCIHYQKDHLIGKPSQVILTIRMNGEETVYAAVSPSKYDGTVYHWKLPYHEIELLSTSGSGLRIYRGSNSLTNRKDVAEYAVVSFASHDCAIFLDPGFKDELLSTRQTPESWYLAVAQTVGMMLGEDIIQP